jgi:AraC-like DNA-binding protein
MQIAGVSPHFVEALLAGAIARGVDPAPLLRVAGIERGQARVSTQAYAALMKAVAFALDDEFFGSDSQRMKPGSFAMLCHAVIGCRTLRSALARAVRFYRLMLDDTAGTVTEENGQLRLEFRSPGPVPLFAHENLLLFLHRLACWLVNRRIPLSALGFAFPEPERADEYRVIFSTEASFGQPYSYFAIDARYGALPLVRDDAALKDFLALAPENLFVRYRPSHGTAHLVRLHLAAMPLTDWPDFAELARSLGMSASTLHRRLADEDSNFQMIKDQIRRERAQALLRQSGRSVMAIAEELGFAEPSAFHRAFRKWTGRAPGQFRKENMMGDV